jgi:hypothetical protein
VKHLSNYWSDLPHILNSDLFDQTKLYECFKWRWPPIEDNLNLKTTSNIKSEISQRLLVRSSSNLKLRLMWMNIISNGRRPQMEDYLKYQKLNISATTGRISTKFKFKLMLPYQYLQMYQMQTTSNGWWPQISKVKYLSNASLDSLELVQ